MKTEEMNPAEKDRYRAYIGMYANNNASIWGQYERLADYVFESYPGTDRRFDEIAVPLLHTIAHGIELGLKENIAFFSEYHEIEHLTKFDNWTALIKSHELADLAEEFKIAYGRLHKKLKLDSNETAEFNKYFSPLLELISILDRSAETYRYAAKIGKNGEFIKMSLEHNKQVDFLKVQELLNQTKTLFLGAPNSVGHFTDFIDYQRAHPEYKKGKGFLYCQRLHFTEWFLKQTQERFDKEMVKIMEGVWFDHKSGENYELQVWDGNIYIIAIDISKARKTSEVKNDMALKKKK
jgi:hypothetical protein